MRKKFLAVDALILCLFLTYLSLTTVGVPNPFPVHNLNTGLDYASIQQAIDAPQTQNGHVIQVDAGTYNENVFVNKSLTIVGEQRDMTILNGTSTDPLVIINSNAVNFTGFTLQGLSFHDISVNASEDVTITGNRIYFNAVGVDLIRSKNCTVSRNLLTGFGLDNIGVMISQSWECTIENNNISGALYDGIRLDSSHEILVKNNNITDNDFGIFLENSSFSTILDNKISNNHNAGICVEAGGNSNAILINNLSGNYRGIVVSSSYNVIAHNNFVNNTSQALSQSLTNVWYSDYEGNYWSDYNGTDANYDGIGDTPYAINFSSTDLYPLMGMFYSNDVPKSFGSGLAVNAISNSTMLGFTVHRVVPVPIINLPNSINLSSETRFLLFNITGEAGTGFSRVCIPKRLMTPPYTIFLNNGLSYPTYYNESLLDNGTRRWIYFTYPQPLTRAIWIWGQADQTSPTIFNVTQTPDRGHVFPTDEVEVHASVTDSQSGVQEVWLQYTVNNSLIYETRMEKLQDSTYNATIPAYPQNTNVTYNIIATDNADNNATTEGTQYETQYEVLPEFPIVLALPLLILVTLLSAIIPKIRKPLKGLKHTSWN